jgi:hypothetical protein
MDIWTLPLIIAIVMIALIGLYGTWKVMKLENRRQQVNDTPIAQTVKDHPTSINPIILVYVVAGILMFSIIMYYVMTSSSY